MDIFEIRYRNFRLLAGHRGGITEAAAKLGKTQGQISHFGGTNPIKNIGNDIAREIEVAWEKPRGWMDAPQWEGATASQPLGLDLPRMHDSIAFLEQQFETWGKQFVASERTTLIAEVYRRKGLPSPPTPIELSQWLADQLQEETHVGQQQNGTGSVGVDDRKGDKKRASQA